MISILFCNFVNVNFLKKLIEKYMKKIIFVLIAFFVFNSCKEDDNPFVYDSKNYGVYGYVLNAGSHDISVIGDNVSKPLHEITKLSLNGNQYPTSFVEFYNYNSGKSYLAVTIAGVEINDNNFGKVWASNNKQKVLFVNTANGKIDYEIKLNSIPYKVIEYNEKIYIGQSREFNSSVLIYMYDSNIDNYVIEDSIVVGDGLTDFIIKENDNEIQLATLDPINKLLNIFNLKTKSLLKKINLNGTFPSKFIVNVVPSANNEPVFLGYSIIDVIGKKLHLVDKDTKTLIETINLDNEVADVFMVSDSQFNTSNPISGNIETYEKNNNTWTKIKSNYVGIGIKNYNFYQHYYSAIALNPIEGTINFLSQSGDVFKIKVGNNPIMSNISFQRFG